MAAYLYYELNRSPIPDEMFDRVCKALRAQWGTFEHQHKYLVTLEDLEAGTGYAIKNYPLMVRLAALTWWKEIEANTDIREDYMKGGYMSS